MARPWVAASWKAYLPKLYAGQRPLDFDQHGSEIVASLHKPVHAKAFSLTTRTTHQQAESRLGEVATPVLVVMGEQDPDFPDPNAEAEWMVCQAGLVKVKKASWSFHLGCRDQLHQTPCCPSPVPTSLT
jgi:pimeloyl-ACP methyl ester carboxylesterase